MTEPENVLWMSVVVQAVQDLSGPDLVAKAARAWFAFRMPSANTC